MLTTKYFLTLVATTIVLTAIVGFGCTFILNPGIDKSSGYILGFMLSMAPSLALAPFIHERFFPNEPREINHTIMD